MVVASVWCVRELLAFVTVSLCLLSVSVPLNPKLSTDSRTPMKINED